MNPAPLFIVMEGTDGSGTTTQGDRLAEALRGLAQTVFLEHARWAMAHPLPLGPEVGRWDPQRCTVQWRGLWTQVLSLAAK